MSTFNPHSFGFKGNVGSECIHGPFIVAQLLLDIELSTISNPLVTHVVLVSMVLMFFLVFSVFAFKA